VASGREPKFHDGHRRHYGEGTATSSNDLAQVLSQLGQALQSNNIAAAQQSYTTLLQDFQQYGTRGAANVPAGSAVSFSA
jgi:hypothetical protein